MSATYRYAFRQIPASGSPAAEEELNHFMATHAVTDVRQEFLPGSTGGHWCFSIHWRDGSLTPGASRKGKPAVDYKEILNPTEFGLFAKLRDLRRDLAKAEEVPAYAVFTNEQLAEMAKARPAGPAALAKLKGVGEGRVEKYGEPFLHLLAEGPEPATDNHSQ